MRLKFLLFFGMLFMLWSCKTNKVQRNKADDLNILEQLSEQKNYHIGIETVYPFNTAATTQVLNSLLSNTGNNASRINVSGDGNYIEIKGDSIKAYLPFFGERRLNSGSYGSADSGIQINDKLNDYSKEVDSRKRKLVLKFRAQQANQGTDKYDVTIEIFPNNKSIVNITPVYRTFIRYSGRLKPLKDKS
jgi:archaellum component FlaF (FlaF/FlaG flagellin family)